MDTSGYESIGVSTEYRENMVVAMKFQRRASGPRKRLTNELKQANKTIVELKKLNLDLARKLKTEQRKRQRVVKRLQTAPDTPRRETEKIMRTADMTKPQRDKVRKAILFGNVIAHQLRKKTEQSNKGSIREIHRLVAGQILKKYRCNKFLCKKVGLNSGTLRRYSTSQSKPNVFKKTQKYENKILDFLEPDDNSRMEPGKADCTKNNDGEVKQTRVLTDYVHNLFQKFQYENPECTVSFATFCRVRSKHVKLCSFISRSSCLCTRHQNMARTAKVLKQQNIEVSVNPDVFVKETLDINTIQNKVADSVKVPQWKRIVVEDKVKDRCKQVMRIVETEMTKHEFLNHVQTQRNDFEDHVDRVKTQYSQIKDLKQNLPESHVLVHMDFAENFACRSSQEIQSAYFNQTAATLHPVVLYYKQDDKLVHKSIVIVSDTMSHNAHTVAAFLDPIVHDIKQIMPDVQVCHYWTDSPTSQYRNKLIFDIIANHMELYNCAAVWNYFESGHGKGPCDGLGGMVKRMADVAINTGKVVFQDASDFFHWASEKSSFSAVTFRFVGESTVVEKTNELSKISACLKPIKGTMKLHAVAGDRDFKVWVRNTSCYCIDCLTGERCNTWTQEQTRKTIVASSSAENTHDPEPIEPGENQLELKVGVYVAAVYESDWFVGRVIDIDDSDGELEISFMERKKQLHQWPRRVDTLWVSRSDILCTLDPPTETGKSKRLFKLPDSVTEKCYTLLAARK